MRICKYYFIIVTFSSGAPVVFLLSMVAHSKLYWLIVISDAPWSTEWVRWFLNLFLLPSRYFTKGLMHHCVWWLELTIHLLLNTPCKPFSVEPHYCTAYSCYTSALHPQTNLTLPWSVVDNVIEKCGVCNCFREENRPSIISLSIQRDLNWFWIIP